MHPNIAATNGTIHIIDGVPREPSTVATLLDDLPPISFSILQRVIRTSGFNVELAENVGRGCTFFAPTNAAFLEIGIRRPGDLERKHGDESLRNLLRSHFCPEQTFYSNIFYRTSSTEEEQVNAIGAPHGSQVPFRKGERTFSPRTAVHGKDMTIKVYHYGVLISMCVNEKALVVSSDHIASNGVVHVAENLVDVCELGDGNIKNER